MLSKEHNKPGHPTTAGISLAIEHLRELLKAQYGGDYAFIVLGHGHVLGASTIEHGTCHSIIEEGA